MTFRVLGQRLLLLNHCYLDANSPYKGQHAIYVREGASQACNQVGRLPEALRSRLISLRAFDAQGWMLDADVAEGAALEPLIERFLAQPDVAFLHAHHARRGCYAARIERA